MAFPRFTSLFSGGFDAELAPAEPVYVVGDIHGRADLLEASLALIARDQEARGLHGVRRVFVGDYIDRGYASRAVIDRLIALKAQDSSVVCLKGNHEAMMLSFLEGAPQGDHWLRNGGFETLESYLGPIGSQHPRDVDSSAFAAQLAEALAGPHAAFLEQLELSFSTGNLFVSHAGADPARPLDAQTEETLLWWRPRSSPGMRKDGQWVAHGHTIVPEPYVSDGRIGLDTGGFATERLTAAFLDRDTVAFLTTGNG